jgi:hypothetical protein
MIISAISVNTITREKPSDIREPAFVIREKSGIRGAQESGALE